MDVNQVTERRRVAIAAKGLMMELAGALRLRSRTSRIYIAVGARTDGVTPNWYSVARNDPDASIYYGVVHPARQSSKTRS